MLKYHRFQGEICLTTLNSRYRQIIANEVPHRVAIYVIGRKVESFLILAASFRVLSFVIML